MLPTEKHEGFRPSEQVWHEGFVLNALFAQLSVVIVVVFHDCAYDNVLPST